jgi:glycine/D-amino acid oxidase-like deaminating enzyme
MPQSIEWPASLWAAVTPAGPSLPAVEGDVVADVVVIGAGFTGLSTALHLARKGVDVAVVEAAWPGWGASGRNNGQVIPTLTRPEPDDIVRRHGEAGERLVHLIRDCAQILFDTARAEGIACEAEQNGWVQPVHSPGRMKIAERRVAQWSKVGAPVSLKSRAEMRDITGSDNWYGGWGNTTGGHINPLALARGLAGAVLKHGGRIYAQSPVETFARGGAFWIARTARGTVKARALVLATNAYTGEFSKVLAPGIARQVVPVFSWQLATAPLSDNVRKSIIPGRQAVSDTHRELYFARYDARNRLVTGGAILLPYRRRERMQPYIAARLERLFPQIGPVKFDYVWNGYVGITRDFFPRMHRLGADGFAWVGCNGRAVGLSVALGGELAKAVTGTPVEELALPLSEPAPLPLHGLVRQLAPAMLAPYRYLDRREV